MGTRRMAGVVALWVAAGGAAGGDGPAASGLPAGSRGEGATPVTESLPAVPSSSTIPATPVAVAPPVSGTPLAAPVLTGGWTLPPSGGCARLPFAVTLTVSNSGTVAAAGLTCRLRIEGSAGATVVEAPVIPDAIPAGDEVSLRWLLVATTGGSVQVRARMRAHDAGGTVTADSGRLLAPEWSLVEPGGLAAAVATRVEASVGQWVAVAVTMSNTGAVRVEHVVPRLVGPAGTGRFRSMPPPVPHLSIEPGASLRLLWTWSVSAAGVHGFTASVFADTCDGALAVAAEASATLAAVPPAALTGSIALSSTRLVSGQRLELRFTVSNAGGAAATGVTVALPTPTTSRAKLLSGPMRALLPALAPGSSTVLAWSWAMDGVGPAWFTGRATGHDGNADWALGTGLVDSPRVRLLAPAAVKADQFTLFPEPRVRIGGYVTASLVLTNTGESDAALTALDIRENTTPGGLLIQRSLVSPSLPMDLPAGDSRSVVWTYRTAAIGKAKLEAKAKIKEAATGRGMPEVKAVSNQIAVTEFLSP